MTGTSKVKPYLYTTGFRSGCQMAQYRIALIEWGEYEDTDKLPILPRTLSQFTMSPSARQCPPRPDQSTEWGVRHSRLSMVPRLDPCLAELSAPVAYDRQLFDTA